MNAINSSSFIYLIVGIFFAMVSVCAEKDSSKIIGAEKCGSCHAAEFKIWKATHHFKTFSEMHKRPRAKEIAKKMGIKGSIKRKGMCKQCHYTVQKKGSKDKAISGISCESCHGPAKDWVGVHNNMFMPPKARYKKVDEAGMIRPARIYNVAENCYQCHTVPNEKLVNVGGHPDSSKDFNLLTWSQGEIRHTFLRSQGVNRDASAERKRVLFVAGSALKLEYGLRGFAKATSRAKYSELMANKMKQAARELNKVAKITGSQEIKDMLATLKRVWKIKLGNEADFLKSADEIKALAEGFIDKYDGSEAELKNLDPLIEELMSKGTKGKPAITKAY